MRTEVWRTIEAFPNYAISNHGQVVSRVTDVIKQQSINQQGIPSVLLMRDQKQWRRSVAVLVAEEFLVPYPSPHFRTPINLDGDRTNNYFENLMWRPRWFAIAYHQQFHPPFKRGYNKPIEDIITGEQFETSWEAAVKYGLIDANILESMMNNTYVFPTRQFFRLID